MDAIFRLAPYQHHMISISPIVSDFPWTLNENLNFDLVKRYAYDAFVFVYPFQFGVLELTPIQRFLRHLILKELDRNSVSRILKLFRKIDWSDESVSMFCA